MAAPYSLVIVESPAKARTIAGYLGKDYKVESSIGHIRDLATGKTIPLALKKEPWAYLGVDVEHGFKPVYVVDADKKAQIAKLKTLLADAKELFLATDEDREGESIAWHLLEVLKPKVPVKRMVFHEITKPAIQRAIANPRQIDQLLVDAQEARRILDRLYGYDVSSVLWRKVKPKLSAGRVQSVATRIVVDREKQRMRFVKASYWDLDATFASHGASFSAGLISVDGQRIASSKDFDESGKLTRANMLLLGEAQAKALAAALPSYAFDVASVERKPNKRSPAAPFMTSTLQQDASRKLRFSAKQAMRAAQSLYEGGYITYMRTDSTQLSPTAVESARTHIQQMYGAEYLPKEPRVYAKKVKNAQEAHEAIRPAGDVFRHPEEVAREVSGEEARLYELIWMRTIASQMNDSIGESVQVRITGKSAGKEVGFSASGHTIVFPGFLRAYVEGSDDPSSELESREKHLPKLDEGQRVPLEKVEPSSHETQPPARFTEASLVQKMEELGVGRPSTYASIMSTIIQRGYVWKKGSALVPSFTAFSVVALLEKHFDGLVDYAFTAKMEDDLDSIAGGQQASEPWLERFYFGEGGVKTAASAKPARRSSKSAAPVKEGASAQPQVARSGGIQTFGLKSLVDRLDEIDARAINSFSLGNDSEGREITIRVGKYGPYLTRGDDAEEKASIPEDLPPDEVTIEKASELLAAPSGDRVVGTDPDTGKSIILRNGRYGAYVQIGDAQEGADKPKTASLLRTMDAATLTLEDALKALTLPRLVGVDPEKKEEILAQIGRYGPYVKRGTDSRSLESEEQVFTVTLDEALAIFLKPKTRVARAASTPLKELAEDPVSKKPIKVLQGRFGMYVTDGETNATLQRDDSLESLTQERAQELLQNRRDKGDSGKRRPPKSGKRPAGRATGMAKSNGKPAAVATEGGPKSDRTKRPAPTTARVVRAGKKSAKAKSKKAAATKPVVRQAK